MANTIAEIWKLHLQALPEADRAEMAHQAHEDLKAWREFFARFKWPEQKD